MERMLKRKRQTTWTTFIKAHWDMLAAIDFTTIEVWTKGGLVTCYVLFVMEVATHRVHFAGCTADGVHFNISLDEEPRTNCTTFGWAAVAFRENFRSTCKVCAFPAYQSVEMFSRDC